MATLHIALTDLPPSVFQALSELKDGDKVSIDGLGRSIALTMGADELPMDASISATIARLRAIEKERGYPVEMDDDYAADVRDIIANRQPGRGDPWA